MVSRVLPVKVDHPVTTSQRYRRTEGRAKRAELGDGWCIFTADPSDPPSPDLLPIALGQALSRWLRTSPEVRVRAVLPIVEDGNTTVLHVWYDRIG